MDESPNPRSFSRVPIDRRAVVLVEDRDIFTAEITNLSMSGMFLKTPERLEIGTECRISIPLTEGGELRIEARAVVARSGAEGFAIHFSSLMGVESYTHLRSLILFNAADPDQAEQEFKTHPGIL